MIPLCKMHPWLQEQDDQMLPNLQLYQLSINVICIIIISLLVQSKFYIILPLSIEWEPMLTTGYTCTHGTKTSAVLTTDL